MKMTSGIRRAEVRQYESPARNPDELDNMTQVVTFAIPKTNWTKKVCSPCICVTTTLTALISKVAYVVVQCVRYLFGYSNNQLLSHIKDQNLPQERRLIELSYLCQYGTKEHLEIAFTNLQLTGESDIGGGNSTLRMALVRNLGAAIEENFDNRKKLQESVLAVRSGLQEVCIPNLSAIITDEKREAYEVIDASIALSKIDKIAREVAFKKMPDGELKTLLGGDVKTLQNSDFYALSQLSSSRVDYATKLQAYLQLLTNGSDSEITKGHALLANNKISLVGGNPKALIETSPEIVLKLLEEELNNDNEGVETDFFTRLLSVDASHPLTKFTQSEIAEKKEAIFNRSDSFDRQDALDALDSNLEITEETCTNYNAFERVCAGYVPLYAIRIASTIGGGDQAEVLKTLSMLQSHAMDVNNTVRVKDHELNRDDTTEKLNAEMERLVALLDNTTLDAIKKARKIGTKNVPLSLAHQDVKDAISELLPLQPKKLIFD